jgi:3-dehydroquinate synthase
MKTIEIKTDTKISKIIIGERLEKLEYYVPDTKVVIITDKNVSHYYKKDFPPFRVIEIGLGEKIKTIDTLNYIFQKFIEYEVDRSSFIVGIGGGIVCDITGLAASIFMRGLKFGFVSTTLLSQVDASVGGKNGVNFQGYKNMIGTFNQPEFVICDNELLKTLEEKEFIAGFAEIVKAGAIKDENIISYLENNYEKALNKDPDVINKLVYDSILIKSKVVESDEREKGERRKLNFGHTFAHSLEKLTGMLHGEAVSAGMVLASRLSVKLNLIQEKDYLRIKKLLENLKLPTTITTEMADIFKIIKQDKKREGETLHIILLQNIGNAIVKQISLKQLEEIIYDLHSDIR